MRPVGLAVLAVVLAVPACAHADNQLPRPVFDPPAVMRAGDPSCLSAARSTDADGQIVAYHWEYGDGISEVASASSCHTFAKGGWYIVKLTLTDDLGATNWMAERIYVHSRAPVPAFTDATTHNAQERRFDATPSRDPDGGIIGYEWNFGDGTTGMGINPVHRFASPGTYTVTLKVTDWDGDSAALSQSVTITLAAPTASIAGATRRCAGETYRVDATAADGDGHITNYRWDLDGKPGFEQDSAWAPVAGAKFSEGTHRIAVRVTDDSGLITEGQAELVFRDCSPKVQLPDVVRARDGGMTIGLKCANACSASAQLLANGTPVGSGTGTLTKAGAGKLRLTLAPKAKRLLLKRRRVHLTVWVTNPGGGMTTLRRQLWVSASRR